MQPPAQLRRLSLRHRTRTGKPRSGPRGGGSRAPIIQPRGVVITTFEDALRRRASRERLRRRALRVGLFVGAALGAIGGPYALQALLGALG